MILSACVSPLLSRPTLPNVGRLCYNLNQATSGELAFACFQSLNPLNLKITAFRIGRNGRCDRMGQAGFFTQQSQEIDMKGFFELRKGATYHEWGEWMWHWGNGILKIALGIVGGAIITMFTSPAPEVTLSVVPATLLAVFLAVVGSGIMVRSLSWYDNHNQVK